MPRPAVLLIFLLVQEAALFASADDFFLKAAKSVPRIGRRAFGGGRGGGGSVRTITADVDHGFFMKAAKSVPRIGRRRAAPAMALSGVAEGRDWGMVWPWYRTPDSVPGPSLADSEPSWMSRRSGEEGWDPEGVPDWDHPRLYVKEGAFFAEGEPEKMGEERVDEGDGSGRVVKRMLASPATEPRR